MKYLQADGSLSPPHGAMRISISSPHQYYLDVCYELRKYRQKQGRREHMGGGGTQPTGHHSNTGRQIWVSGLQFMLFLPETVAGCLKVVVVFHLTCFEGSAS